MFEKCPKRPNFHCKSYFFNGFGIFSTDVYRGGGGERAIFPPTSLFGPKNQGKIAKERQFLKKNGNNEEVKIENGLEEEEIFEWWFI